MLNKKVLSVVLNLSKEIKSLAHALFYILHVPLLVQVHDLQIIKTYLLC